MRILTVAFLAFLSTGCKTTPLASLIGKEPRPILKIQTITEINKITNKITTNGDAGDLYIVGTCDYLNGNQFAFFSIKNDSAKKWSITYKSDSYMGYTEDPVGKLRSISDLNIWKRGSNIGLGRSSANNFSNNHLKKVIDDLKISLFKTEYKRRSTKIAEYTSEDLKVKELFNNCNRISNEQNQKRLIEINSEKERTRKHVEESSEILGKEPIYQGSNVSSFLQLGNDVVKQGEEKFKNKFFWALGDYYKVTKVNEITLGEAKGTNVIVLAFDSYKYKVRNKLPVVIVSKERPIIGQAWKQVTRTPIVFGGIISGKKLREAGLLTSYEEQYMLFIDP